MFYSIGHVGHLDVERAVRRGALPASALDVERTRAMIGIWALSDAQLTFVAYGNEDAVYGQVAQAEIARRRTLDAAA